MADVNLLGVSLRRGWLRNAPAQNRTQTSGEPEFSAPLSLLMIYVLHR